MHTITCLTQAMTANQKYRLWGGVNDLQHSGMDYGAQVT